jgi:rare lipoprotein A
MKCKNSVQQIFRVFVVTALLISFLGCSHNTVQQEPSSSSQQVFVGLASFYASKFNGKDTASGSVYDRNQFTAAHRTLPFGTKVLVTNLENSLSVVVTISDRGPEERDRIIDLSFAAAQQLNMLSVGVVKVRIEVLNE